MIDDCNTHAEEVAMARLRMITPLLNLEQDRAELRRRLETEAKLHGVSVRSLRRHLANYKKRGFVGLKPKPRSRDSPDAIDQEVFERAVALRKENPRRGVLTIIKTLERGGVIEKDEVKRSTLQRRFERIGLSRTTMKNYDDPAVASRRFQHPHRNCLWQTDIKEGPIVDGRKTRAVAIIDDCTRLVLHAQFYHENTRLIVEDSLRKAVLKYGVPDAVYCDNGTQFKNRDIRLGLNKLGSRLITTKIYSPESKGKIERFNQHIQRLIDERGLEGGKNDTLHRINEDLWAWLDTWYQDEPHSALGDGVTPRMAFEADSRPLTLRTAEEIAVAFKAHVQRMVDKGGWVSVEGAKYEAKALMSQLGRYVNVRYDRLSLDEVEIVLDKHNVVKAQKIVITATAGKRPELPRAAEKLASGSSALIDIARKNREKKLASAQAGISYSELYAKGVPADGDEPKGDQS